MKKILLLATIISMLHTSHAQERYRELLATNPDLSNGYFIIDSAKAARLGVVRLLIEIDANRANSDSTLSTRNLQSINITNGHYGALDTQILGNTDEFDRIFYTLTGFDQSDNVIWGPVSNLGENPWPEVCRTTCHSIHYAWSLFGYGNGGLGSMQITDGSQDGSHFYFYMKESDFHNWSLGYGNTPADYGFTWTTSWTEVFAAPSDEVILLTLTGNELAQNGYAVGGAGQPGVGIRKDKGPWRYLFSWTNSIDQSLMCLNMQPHYNNDGLVQSNLAALTPNPGPLQCWSLPGGGGGLSWGSSGPFNPCTQVSVWEFGGNL